MKYSYGAWTVVLALVACTSDELSPPDLGIEAQDGSEIIDSGRFDRDAEAAADVPGAMDGGNGIDVYIPMDGGIGADVYIPMDAGQSMDATISMDAMPAVDAGRNCEGPIFSCRRFCGDDVVRSAECVGSSYRCPSDFPISDETYDFQCEGKLTGPCRMDNSCEQGLACSNRHRCLNPCPMGGGLGIPTCRVGPVGCCGDVVNALCGPPGVADCPLNAVEESMCQAFPPAC